MLRLPVVSKGITLQEIPGEIAVFFELGNCRSNCLGCHSQHLQRIMPRWMETSIEEMVEYVKEQKALGATAVVLMGGTTNGIGPFDLAGIICKLGDILPIGLYSGMYGSFHYHAYLVENTSLQWLKTGPYQEDLGPLSSPTTNQRFYHRIQRGPETIWEDQTYLFRKTGGDK